ncbi:hypothetical protein ACI2OX_03930 [Bacillus sp. N9]
MGNEQGWTLRPNWLWNRLLEWLHNDFGLPYEKLEPTIRLSDKSIDEVISASTDWFLHSGMMPKLDGSLEFMKIFIRSEGM